MQDSQRFFVNKSKFFAALAVFAFFVVISVSLVTLKEYLAAAVFFALGSLFIPSVLQYGKVVEIDENGVRLSLLLGRLCLELKWDEAAEVGVAGDNLFRRNKKSIYETFYIYLSSSVMTEDDRFEMMLKFPPRDKICFVYSRSSFNALRSYWHGPIYSYNTGDKRFGES